MTDEFLASENIMPGTRASWFRRFFHAIGADLSAIWKEVTNNVDIDGPTVIIQNVADASSIGYYELVENIPVYDSFTVTQKETFDSLQAVYPLDPLNLDIAHTHNALILQMIKDKSWHPEDPEKLVTSTVNTIKRIGVDTSEASISERVDTLTRYMVYYKNNPIIFPVAKPLANTNPMSYLINNYLYNLQQLDNPNRVKKYTTVYIHRIENSIYQGQELNERDKQNTIDIIKLTCASYDLWYHISNL
ncbi:MAG: hypothetical protein K2L00_03955 [Muribaculaceae bacterium]|nr:hypothetical protein [Muribaculaceae bacterium]